MMSILDGCCATARRSPLNCLGRIPTTGFGREHCHVCCDRRSYIKPWTCYPPFTTSWTLPRSPFSPLLSFSLRPGAFSFISSLWQDNFFHDFYPIFTCSFLGSVRRSDPPYHQSNRPSCGQLNNHRFNRCLGFKMPNKRRR